MVTLNCKPITRSRFDKLNASQTGNGAAYLATLTMLVLIAAVFLSR